MIFNKYKMKTRTILLWILVLIITDQLIKLVINNYFWESHFEIIPSLLEFEPTFNDKYSYLNSLMNLHFNINIGLWIHLILFFFAESVILTLYSFFRNRSLNTKLLDAAIAIQSAGMACTLIGNLIWEKGILDYIYLKPLFVFDMKDLYMNCFAVLFLVHFHKNKASLQNIKMQDIISHIGNKLQLFLKR